MSQNALQNGIQFFSIRRFILLLVLFFAFFKSFAQSSFNPNQSSDRQTAVLRAAKNTDALVDVEIEEGYVRSRSWKDKKGNVVQTIKYYDANNLNPFIGLKVLQRFQGKKIFGASEISTASGIYYYIVLEDDKNWYYVTSDSEGNIALSNKFNKA